METLIDRRAIVAPASSSFAQSSKTVQQGILLQACLGSMSAVEYLKARGIDSRVSTRVLGRERVRGEDNAALAQRKADLQLGA